MKMDGASFARHHGQWAAAAGPVVVVYSPGRVNLIGEHTDYNGGHVLPVALDVGITAALSARGDPVIRVRSSEWAQVAKFRHGMAALPPEDAWARYVLGAATLLAERLDTSLPGFDLSLTSNLPSGAGLSSSAALDVAVLEALLALTGNSLSAVDVARLAQQVEERFAGVRCGLMDPYVSRLGRRGHALYLDCATQSHEDIALPEDRLVLVLFDSGVKHALASSAYNQRRAECAAGLAQLQKWKPQYSHLAHFVAEPLKKVMTVVTEDIQPRIRHVLTEEHRTQRFVQALHAGDFAELGRCMAGSHLSLRDDYRVSCPELDVLVAAAAARPECFGARMTGGGFGGSTVNLVRPDGVATFVAAVRQSFATTFGYAPAFRCHRCDDGTRRLA